VATLRAADLHTIPYHVDVPSFGDWGFVLASDSPVWPTMYQKHPPLRFLTEDVLTAATTFPKDRDKLDVPASTLMDPRILRYAQSEWSVY